MEFVVGFVIGAIAGIISSLTAMIFIGHIKVILSDRTKDKETKDG